MQLTGMHSCAALYCILLLQQWCLPNIETDASYARCSGISDIRAYLNGIHIRNLLSIRTLIAKSFGVSFAIASGLVAGKEVGWVVSAYFRLSERMKG
jgi:H+/Cl- antiporter ClcA